MTLADPTISGVRVSAHVLAAERLMKDVVDSKDCREYARRCIEIANATAPYGAQSTLRELARSWIKIADQIDERGALDEASASRIPGNMIGRLLDDRDLRRLQWIDSRKAPAGCKRRRRV